MLRDGATVPQELHHERFVVTPLTADNAALDYACYLASPEVIRRHSGGRWPIEGFTLDDDLKLVAHHQADHESRRAFTFVLLAPSRTEAFGCVYLNPLQEHLEAVPTAAAMVTFWLRQDLQLTDLPQAVAAAVNDWLLTEWPLDLHLFRVLPEEVSSIAALEQSGLAQISPTVRDEARPYLWFQPTL